MDFSQIFENLGQQSLPCTQHFYCSQPGCRNPCLIQESGYPYTLCYGHMLSSYAFTQEFSATQFYNLQPFTTNNYGIVDPRRLPSTQILSSQRNYSLTHRPSLCRQPGCLDEFCNDCNHLKPTSSQYLPDQSYTTQQIFSNQQNFLTITNQQVPNQHLSRNNSVFQQRDTANGYPGETKGQIPMEFTNQDPTDYSNNQNTDQDLAFANQHSAASSPLVETPPAIVSPQNISTRQIPMNTPTNNEYPLYIPYGVQHPSSSICNKQYCDGGSSCTNCLNNVSQNIYTNSPVQQHIMVNNAISSCPVECQNHCYVSENGQEYKYSSGGGSQSTSSVSASPISTNTPTTPVTAMGTPAFTPAMTIGVPTLTSLSAPTSQDAALEPTTKPQGRPEPNSMNPTPSPAFTTELTSSPVTTDAQLPQNTPPVASSLIKQESEVNPTNRKSPVASHATSKSLDENIVKKKKDQKPKSKSRKLSDSEKNISSRVCSREGCTTPTYIKTKRSKRFDSYCSEICFWREVDMLTETRTKLLDKNDSDYVRVATGFKQNLKKFRVKGVIRLQMSAEITNKHKAAKHVIAASTHFKPEEITRKLYRGTKSLCDPSLIIRGSSVCKNEACEMCQIVHKGSFKRLHSKDLWFTQNPSGCLDNCGGGKIQAVFLVDVVNVKKEEQVLVEREELVLPRFLIFFGKS